MTGRFENTLLVCMYMCSSVHAVVLLIIYFSHSDAKYTYYVYL